MRFVFLITILAGPLIWFYLPQNTNINSASASPSKSKNQRIYERYQGNTVPEPTWSSNADTIVLVNIKGYKPYFIDKYEAVISQQRAWSVSGQVPTTKLTFQDAKDACQAAQKRLCTTDEWRIACRDGRIEPFYFKNTNAMLRSCDFARSNGYDKNDHPGKTDSHPSCKGPQLGLNHMYGNVVEMTQGPRGKAVILGMSYLGTKYYGAGFDGNPNKAMQMACEYTVIDNYPAGRHNEGMGFRCCSDAKRQ